MTPSSRLPACLLPSAILLVGQPALAQAASNRSSEPLETIVVTGTRATMESARVEVDLTPGGAGLIDLDDFRDRNVSSLADVLLYTPGVWSASHAGTDDIFFSSRGSNLDATNYDMNGIKLMQDGLPVTTADGNNHNRIVDPQAARFATVARGANALKHGASTLGGAIDFVTPTAHDGTGVDLMVNGGSHGQLIARATVSQLFADERADGLATLEAKQWDGYREHNELSRFGIYANAGWQVSPTVATRFYGTYLDSDQELPGQLTREQFDADPSQANPSNLSGHFQIDVDTFRLANKTTWQLGAGRQLDVGFSIEDQTLYHPIVDRILVDFDGDGPEPPVEVFSLLIDTDHRDVGAVVRYNHRVGAHDLLLGLNYGRNAVDGGHYRNLHGQPNGLTTIIDNDASQLELFAMDRWQLRNDVTLIAAAQLVSANRNVRNTDVDSGTLDNPNDDYSSINPTLGLLYDLGQNVTLYGNLSSLYEAPTNFELQDNAAGGSATLDAMTGTVLEIGTRGGGALGERSSWTWDVSVYYAEIDDEILSVEDPDAPGTSLVTNVDATVHAGIEALVSARIGIGGSASLEPLVSLTMNDFTFAGDPVYRDNQLPAAPDYALRGEIIYRSGSGFYVGPTVELVGRRWADFANTYEVDSYTLLGLRAGWSRDDWSVYADLRNVLDEAYVATHAVRNVAAADDAILNPGEPASIYVGLTRRFD